MTEDTERLNVPFNRQIAKKLEISDISVLVEAANKNDVSLLGRCLSGRLGPVAEDDLDEAMIRAANNGNVGCVSALLAHGVSPEVADADNDTPLMLAACNNKAEVIRVLLAADCRVNVVSDSGRTALHMASWNGHAHLVTPLLDSGTDPGIQDCNGDTALMLAALNGHTHVVKTLLEVDCDVDAKNNDGDTPLHYASKRDCPQIVRLLIQAGCDKNAQNYWGATPLMLAVDRNCVGAVRTLLAARVDCNLCSDRTKATALHWAAMKGHLSCVELLLAHGAHPDPRDVDECSPLSVAMTHSHTAVVRLLVKAGVDVDQISTAFTSSRLAHPSLAENEDLVKILVFASSRQNFAKSLLLNMSGNPTKRAVKWLREYTSVPERLTQLCRREIRRALRGRTPSVYVLPLPFSLKMFLHMGDI